MALIDDIISYYKLENTDDSHDNKNLTNNNSVTFTSGKIDNAATYASASSQYLTAPNSLIPWGTNTLTVNMWVKFSNTSGNQSFIHTARNATNKSGLGIYKSGTDTITFSKPYVLDLNYDWTDIDTDWHMWTFVADGDGMRIYLDGNSTPVATNTNTTNFVDPSEDTLEFGAYRLGGSIQANWYMNGQHDEIGIWERALTTGEISSLYNDGDGLQYPFEDFTFTETISFTEQKLSKIKAHHQETLNISESVLRKVKATFQEIISLAEDTFIGFILTFTETLNISDETLKRVKSTFQETLNLTDTLFTRMGITLTETISLIGKSATRGWRFVKKQAPTTWTFRKKRNK